MAAFNIWLGGLVERQGRQELEVSAHRHMALSEARVDRVLAAIEDVAKRGINSCQPAHIEALRQATFTTFAVKEFSIIDADGRTLCTDVGSQPDQRRVVSSELLAAG